MLHDYHNYTKYNFYSIKFNVNTHLLKLPTNFFKDFPFVDCLTHQLIIRWRTWLASSYPVKLSKRKLNGADLSQVIIDSKAVRRGRWGKLSETGLCWQLTLGEGGRQNKWNWRVAAHTPPSPERRPKSIRITEEKRRKSWSSCFFPSLPDIIGLARQEDDNLQEKKQKITAFLDVSGSWNTCTSNKQSLYWLAILIA